MPHPEQTMDPKGSLDVEGLVHDLNNVFETISEAAELLEEDSKWSSVAATIQRSIDRGRRILGSYSESVRGEQDFEQVLESSIEFANDLFKAVHAPPVRFQLDIEPGIRLRGTAVAWERILLNLFLNAAQAVQDGCVVTISASTRPDCHEIRISDNGPGIPREILPQIFDPHFSTKSASSGLGLHIVKSLVLRVGGEVSASNRERSSGASFRIRMPRA